MASFPARWMQLAWVACATLAGCGITVPGNLSLGIDDPSVIGAAGAGGSLGPWGGVAGGRPGGGPSPVIGTAGSWGGYSGSGVAGWDGFSAGRGVAGWGGYAGAGVAGVWGGSAGARPPSGRFDNDNDGWSDDSDCDDFNANIHPGARDACCDRIDNDCDGGDGRVGEVCDCSPPIEDDWDGDGFTESQGDCNDSSWQINPRAIEYCDDGIDNDCDGWVDYADTCAQLDNDHDGYPDVSDCDPWNANVNPGAGEICGDGIDNNCDGSIDGYPYCKMQEVDWDRDGYPYEKDCNDGDATVFPGSPYEQCCDGVDSNCDGADGVANGICTCPVPNDRDGDGYGIGMADPALADCNDQDANIHPKALEDCSDQRDNDCDGLVDLKDPDCQKYVN